MNEFDVWEILILLMFGIYIISSIVQFFQFLEDYGKHHEPPNKD